MPQDPGSGAQADTRRLAAIMFTDMVGFSRQMGSNEARMLRLLDTHNALIRQAVAEHHGTIIKTGGDSFLVDFPSVVHAMQCAQQIQAQFCAHNAGKEPAEQIHVRIGSKRSPGETVVSGLSFSDKTVSRGAPGQLRYESGLVCGTSPYTLTL
jgi:class 3 adenylate cyclase